MKCYNWYPNIKVKTNIRWRKSNKWIIQLSFDFQVIFFFHRIGYFFHKFYKCILKNNIFFKIFYNPSKSCFTYLKFWLLERLVLLTSNSYVIKIIVMSRWPHGSPWPSLATRLYRLSLPVGLLGYFMYWHSCCI